MRLLRSRASALPALSFSSLLRRRARTLSTAPPPAAAAAAAAAAAPAPLPAAVPTLPADARQPGHLLVWGRGEDARLGMRLAADAKTDAPFLHVGCPSVAAAAAAHPGAPLQPWGGALHGAIVQVVCRASKTLVLTADGAVWSWGTCANLSLGHGERVSRASVPRRIEALAGIRIVQIDAGETSCAAVSDEGELFTWGWGGSFWGGNGGLGHGDNATQPRPALVESLQKEGAAGRVASVAVGTAHMLALTRDGRAYSWGNGEYGRLGNGKGAQLRPEPVVLLDDVRAQARNPGAGTRGAGADGGRVVQLAAGQAHSLAVLADGRLLAWGKNEASQLGLGGAMVMDLNTMEAYPTPVELGGGGGGAGDDDDEAAAARRFNGRVVRVAAGQSHSLALTRDGGVWHWGGRLFIQPTLLPFGTLKIAAAEGAAPSAAPSAAASAAAPAPASPSSAAPAKAAAAATRAKEGDVPLRGVEIAAGDGASAVVDADGRLFTWGRMLSAPLLGHASASRLPRFGVRQPTCVEALQPQPAGSAPGAHGRCAIPVSSVSLGAQHSAAVTGIPRSL